MQQQISQLVNLPVELLLNILGWLDFRTLLTCKMVCRSLHALVVSSAEFEYKIELGAAGCEDGPPSAVSSRGRLEMLRRREAAWDMLQWTSETIVPMLAGGVWELYGGVLAQARGRETLVFRRLPSEIKGITELDWECRIGFTVRDFGMDPSQDLLAIVENPNGNSIHRIHLRSILDAKSHPKAANSTLVTESPEGVGFTFAIQVCNEHLGILFIGNGDGSDTKLLIWNWRKGTEEMALRGRELASFSFLTDRHVLVAFINPVFLQEAPQQPAFLVIDFTKQTSAPIDIREIEYECAFDLPEMAETGIAISLSIRSDPAPTWAPSENLNVPFHIAQGDRLFVNTLWVADGHTIISLLVFVPSSTFLSHLSSLDATEKGRRFAWDEWGPTGCRVREAPTGHSMVWVCYVSGLAFSAPCRGVEVFDHPRGPKSVQIYDFNQFAIRRALACGEDKDESGTTTVITAESSITVRGVFTHPVRTSLPYRSRIKKVPHNSDSTFDAVMLSEDAIVTVTSKPDVREYRVLSF